MAAAIYYLSLFEIVIDITNEEYELFMLRVVNNKPAIVEISSWLERHSA
jgi:hypothetical protein